MPSSRKVGHATIRHQSSILSRRRADASSQFTDMGNHPGRCGSGESRDRGRRGMTSLGVTYPRAIRHSDGTRLRRRVVPQVEREWQNPKWRMQNAKSLVVVASGDDSAPHHAINGPLSFSILHFVFCIFHSPFFHCAFPLLRNEHLASAPQACQTSHSPDPSPLPIPRSQHPATIVPATRNRGPGST